MEINYRNENYLLDDSKSRKIVKAYFEENGWSCKDTEQSCRWDITATKDDKDLLIEVKARSCKSTAFGDTIVDESKYEYLKDKKAVIINMYSDGKMALHWVNEPHKIIVKYAPKSTFDDGPMIYKNLCSYTNKNLVDFTKYIQ